MSVFEEMARRDHEQLVFCHDEATGLKAIIAIHNTTLGPALGGCRMWHYEKDEDALRDVLRLSRGMTYKSAAAGLNLGGGKAVIIGDSKKMKNEALFRSYGRFVQSMAGRYITAEDVGTSVRDMEWVRNETNYVTGISRALGGSGDPSPFTALGVMMGMKAALKWQTGQESLAGKKVSVQGVGHVGFHLVRHLLENGAQPIICDIDQDNLRKVGENFQGVEVVAPDDIYGVDCDIFAPNAMGAVINDQTIPQLKCGIVAGSANNVLAVEEIHAPALKERGILYAPDYVINAGGLVNVANELEGYNKDRATNQVAAIYDILTDIFRIAETEGITTQKAANTLAERRIVSMGRIKHTYTGIPVQKRQKSQP